MKRTFPNHRIARGVMIAPFMAARGPAPEEQEWLAAETSAESLTRQDRLALECAENEGMVADRSDPPE